MSSVLIACLLKTSHSASPKSPPTTPTAFTFVKKLADNPKCVAAPPRTLSRLPNGVSIASNATEPTTVKDIKKGSPRIESTKTSILHDTREYAEIDRCSNGTKTNGSSWQKLCYCQISAIG